MEPDRAVHAATSAPRCVHRWVSALRNSRALADAQRRQVHAAQVRTTCSASRDACHFANRALLWQAIAWPESRHRVRVQQPQLSGSEPHREHQAATDPAASLGCRILVRFAPAPADVASGACSTTLRQGWRGWSRALFSRYCPVEKQIRFWHLLSLLVVHLPMVPLFAGAQSSCALPGAPRRLPAGLAGLLVVLTAAYLRVLARERVSRDHGSARHAAGALQCRARRPGLHRQP